MRKPPEKGFIQLQKKILLGCYSQSCVLAKPVFSVGFCVSFLGFFGSWDWLFGFFSLRTK